MVPGRVDFRFKRLMQPQWLGHFHFRAFYLLTLRRKAGHAPGMSVRQGVEFKGDFSGEVFSPLIFWGPALRPGASRVAHLTWKAVP